MKLYGLDLCTVLGAITLYLTIPFTRTPKRSLDEGEEELLLELQQRIRSARDSVYPKPSDYPSRATLVQAHLAVETEVTLETHERQLLAEICMRVYEEGKEGPTLNVFINGDEYGITPADYVNIAQRLAA